jgi:hypothetical protein
MIGRYQIQLGANEFISGMASSDYATDGSLGISSKGLNPFVTPGVIYALQNVDNLSFSSVINGNIIASCEDSRPIFAYARTWVDDAGNYYTYNGTTVVTLTNTATTNVAGYIGNKTDMVSFAGNTYVTTSTDIDLWNTAGAPTLTNSWWVGTKGKTAMSTIVPHPLIAYGNHLYVADFNIIHSISSSGTIDTDLPALPLTLNSNDAIYALGIDPGTGLMMISIQSNVNISDTLTSKFYVGLWDGISATLTRKIPVTDLITSFTSVEGQVYVGMGQTIGVWNGTGITFLRKLKNVGLTADDLPYKHRVSTTRNILHVVDGDKVLSYGTIVAGQKKGWFYTAYNPLATGNITALLDLGQNRIGIAFPTKNLYLYDFSKTTYGGSAGGGTGSIYFNNIYFPRPIFVRRVRVVTTGLATNGGIHSLSIYDEKNVFHTTTQSTFPVLASESPKYVFDFDFTNLKVQAIQPVISFYGSVTCGLVRIYIYYDIAE